MRVLLLLVLLFSSEVSADLKVKVYRWEHQNSVYAQCGVVTSSCIRVYTYENGTTHCVIHTNRHERTRDIRRKQDYCEQWAVTGKGQKLTYKFTGFNEK